MKNLRNHGKFFEKSITGIDRIMIVLARDLFKKMSKPEFLLLDEHQLLAHLKKNFTIQMDAECNFSLQPLVVVG